MKISQIALLSLAGLVLQTHAVTVDINQVAEVKPPEDIKTVTHMKKPNGGYKKGSPLYNKQEGISEERKPATKKKKKTEAAIVDPDKALTEAHKDLGYKKPNFYETLGSVSVYAIFVLAFAYFYRNKMVAPLGTRAKGEAPMRHPGILRCGFAYSVLDFGNIGADWQICLTAACCPIIQWARTASSSVTPFMSYWKAVAFLLTMVVLAPFTWGLTGLVIMIAMVKRRRELRKAYSHSHPEGRSLLEDLVLVFCCPSLSCCQLVQEAREVEYTSPKQTA